MDDPIDRLLARLDQAKEIKPDRWVARCPAHDDRSPSLSIARGDDGRVLLKCWTGCTAPEITQAVGLSLADLFVREERRNVSPGRQRQYPNYKNILIELEHELWVIHLAACDVLAGKALSGQDQRALERANDRVYRTLRAINA